MVTWSVLFPALIISFGGGFHYGYQLTVINPSEISFRNFINDSYQLHYGSYLKDSQWMYLWPVIVNMQTLGCLIGTFFTGYILETLGRKRGFYVTNGLVIFSCVLQSISKPCEAWELFMIGRFVCGIAQGIQLGLQPVYFAEISKKSERGLIGSMTGFSVEVGFLLASILAMPTLIGDANQWPYLFVIESAPSMLAMIVLPILPESPKYLASRGGYRMAARALRWFGRSSEEIREELTEIRLELTKDTIKSSSAMSVRTLFSIPYIRKGVFLGWMVMFSGAYSGVMALSFFSTSILEASGLSQDHALYGTLGTTAVSCFGAFLGSLIMDRFGRRRIMLTANAVLLFLNIIFVIFGHLSRVYMMKWASYANIAVVVLISLMYCLGPTMVQWFLTSELVPQRARSTANTMAMLSKWILFGTAGLIFYPLQRVIYEFSFLLHIVPLLVSIIYFAIALPETKNRSTLEIIAQLGYCSDHPSAKAAARKSIPVEDEEDAVQKIRRRSSFI